MEENDNHWRKFYIIGAISTMLVLCGIVTDMVVGSFTGGDIVSLPGTAVERFIQLKETPLLGLYNLDFLNALNQLLLIPSIFALAAVHRRVNPAGASFAFVLFLTGTILFVAGNTALTMLDLSHKYFSADPEMQKTLIAAAGEAMLAKGQHGSMGVFIGFVLPTLANLLMSRVMLKGKVFKKAESWIGISGNTLMLFYIILVTFFPAAGKSAMALAMPGGLLLMTWMILFTMKLFRLGFSGNNIQTMR